MQKSLVEGVVVEAGRPKVARGWGGVPLCAPSPEFFFSILELKMDSFGALWVPVGGCIPLILPLDPPLSRGERRECCG